MPETFDCVRPPLTMDVLYAIDEGRPIEVLYEGEWLALADHYARDPLDFPRLLTDEQFEWRWAAGAVSVPADRPGVAALPDRWEQDADRLGRSEGPELVAVAASQQTLRACAAVLRAALQAQPPTPEEDAP